MVRSESELSLMRGSGKISARAMKKVLEAVKPGVNLLELERIATDEILALGGKISFKTEPGYHWASCLTVNDEVVHGIPRDIILKKGDKFSVDLGALYKGWHTDMAWSLIVGEEPNKFLKIGEEALWKGVAQAIAGNRIGDIGSAIQETVEGVGGYKVVRSLIGHGVGKSLHEKPDVPGYGVAHTGLVLQEGETIAVEVIYTEGTTEVKLSDDGWTISSADGSMGGLFEMTVIVGKKKPEVITDWRKV